MIHAGIDIGSRFVKLAVVIGTEVQSLSKASTSHDPLATCRSLLRDVMVERVVATGYGRHLLEVHGDISTITEIKAFARGSRSIFPSCRTVVDIGGQDTKVICLNEQGAVWKFEMNDRCAAGTGKFMEIMAKTLGYKMEEFGLHAATGRDNIKLSSICTVFAESEVISLIAKGVAREEIALAIHRSVANRVAGMAKRYPVVEDVVFAGGCAGNDCLQQLLQQQLDKTIHVNRQAEYIGAIGAALYAAEM